MKAGKSLLKYNNANFDAIDAKETDYLYVKESQIPDAGNGLFTAIDIYKDEIISIFRGEILTNAEAKIRANNGNDRYFINMPNGTIMDSNHRKCFAKFANDANGFVKTRFAINSVITLEEHDRVCLVATRNLKAGDEVFCSYGKKYWRKFANYRSLGN
jgi:uncharacterized protein